MTAGHSVTVILSSYQQPSTLRLVLEGLCRQDHRGFDVVVGDDGSEADTFALCEEYIRRGAFELRTTTQPDEGFRKASALNNAIRTTTADQLVFFDGDCVPYADAVLRHVEAYDPRGYAAGAYVRLTAEQSRALTPEMVAAGEHERMASPEQLREILSIHRHNQLYRLLRKPRKPRLLGGNFSVGRELMLSVNGFDNRFSGFSGEDSDVRNRFNRAGARRRSLWNRAFVCHVAYGLDAHRERSNVHRDSNRELIKENSRRARTPDGLVVDEPDAVSTTRTRRDADPPS